MATRYTVEARELHPVTGEPLGEWENVSPWKDAIVDRHTAVWLATSWEDHSLVNKLFKARIREWETP